MKRFRVRYRQVIWFDEWVEAANAAEARDKSECGYGSEPEYDDYTETEVIDVQEEGEVYA